MRCGVDVEWTDEFEGMVFVFATSHIYKGTNLLTKSKYKKLLSSLVNHKNQIISSVATVCLNY